MGEDADEYLQGIPIAAIGPVTAKSIEKAGLRVDIMPKEATIEAMVEEIIQWIQKKHAKEIKSDDQNT
jgi:uroporphyrinogen III methyltransferase/synthase